MGDVGGDTGATADVVEGQLGDPGVELEEERQGLANAAGSTEDSNLGQLLGAGEESVKKGCEVGFAMLPSAATADRRLRGWCVVSLTHVSGGGREGPSLDSCGKHFDGTWESEVYGF